MVSLDSQTVAAISGNAFARNPRVPGTCTCRACKTVLSLGPVSVVN